MILQSALGSMPGHQRTGPLGRLARLALLGVFGGSLYSIADRSGSARFRNPHILTEPSAWLLHVMMLILFVVLVGMIASVLMDARLVRRTQIGAVAGLLGTGTVAAIIGQAAVGTVWGFPLADLVWWFDVVMLAVGFVSTVLAVVLGTPGCEIGVLAKLVACLRRTPPPSTDAAPCIVGLHALDDWERRRTARGRPGDSTAPLRPMSDMSGPSSTSHT